MPKDDGSAESMKPWAKPVTEEHYRVAVGLDCPVCHRSFAGCICEGNPDLEEDDE